MDKLIVTIFIPGWGILNLRERVKLDLSGKLSTQKVDHCTWN